MIKIMSDSSSLYTIEEGQKKGIEIVPLSVTINNETYRDFEDISSEEFISIIEKGHMPKSSQPSLGEVIDIYNKYPDDEIINITIADGLSGTYNTAVMAKDTEDKSHCIDVVNSKTLCMCHRHLVDVAAKMASENKSKEEILNKLDSLIDTSRSYLIPTDFDFLVRGGRMSHLAGRIGSAIKLIPVLNLDKDGTKLHKFAVARTINKAISKVCDDMIEDGVNDEYIVGVYHACVESQALDVVKIMEKKLPGIEIKIGKLSPAFITQGGPGCIAIQYIKR